MKCLYIFNLKNNLINLIINQFDSIYFQFDRTDPKTKIKHHHTDAKIPWKHPGNQKGPCQTPLTKSDSISKSSFKIFQVRTTKYDRPEVSVRIKVKNNPKQYNYGNKNLREHLKYQPHNREVWMVHDDTIDWLIGPKSTNPNSDVQTSNNRINSRDRPNPIRGPNNPNIIDLIGGLVVHIPLSQFPPHKSESWHIFQ